MTSVVIVADNGADMALLTSSVNGLRNTEIVRHASGRASIQQLVEAHRPTLVLISEMSPRRVTLERLSEVRAAAPEAAVIVVAADAGSRWLAQALRAGATAVVPGGTALAAVLAEVLSPDPAGVALAA
jgi:DNA-binding NarL/FixJ family response regulator